MKSPLLFISLLALTACASPAQIKQSQECVSLTRDLKKDAAWTQSCTSDSAVYSDARSHYFETVAEPDEVCTGVMILDNDASAAAKTRKINCKERIPRIVKATAQASSNDALCNAGIYGTANPAMDDAVKAEIKRRGTDCATLLSLRMQQAALEQQRRAAVSQAFFNASANIQRQQALQAQQQAIYNAQRPIHTTCNQTGVFTNCTGY
jgi:hypothetical protein